MKIAVASGKGGTGKTLVSTNLFEAIRQEGMPVTIIDCDAEEPNVGEFIKGVLTGSDTIYQKVPVIDKTKCDFCGKCQEYCNYNAIFILKASRNIQVIEDICHDCGACVYACRNNAVTEKEKPVGKISYYNVSPGSMLIESRIDVGVYSPVKVIKKAIISANNDIVILDSPPGISCPFMATVVDADYTILVTEPTPFGLNDLKLSVDTLRKMKKEFGVIVNRCNAGNNAVYDYLAINNIDLLMEIPFERKIAELYSEGNLIIDALPVYKKQFMSMLDKICQLKKVII